MVVSGVMSVLNIATNVLRLYDVIFLPNLKNMKKNNSVKADVVRSAIRCFECKEEKNLIKDSSYRDTYWCKAHYKERHAIISDFIHHAVTGL